MVQRYFIITSNKISETESIDNLGIVLRGLSDDEKNKILYNMYENFFNKTIEKEGNNIINNRPFIEVKEELKNYLLAYLTLSKYNMKFNKNYLKRILNKLLIIEIDIEKIKKFVLKEDSLESFIINYINLCFSLKNKDSATFDINILTHKWPLNENNDFICGNDVYSFIFQIANSQLPEYNAENKINFYFPRDITIKELIETGNIFKANNTSQIENFLLTIDSIFQNNNRLENKITNCMTIIERIITFHDTSTEKVDNKKQFTLKIGLVCDLKDTDLESSSKFLKLCYDVRSAIIHGSNSELDKLYLTYLNYLKSTVPNFDAQLFEKKLNIIDKFDKRYILLFVASKKLEECLKELIVYWIKNPTKIAFIKAN